jgi:hypothetical protein
MTALLVFLLSLAQNYLATRQIHAISQSDPLKSALWAGLTAAASGSREIIFVVSIDRWRLLLPSVLGDVLATYVALYRRKT